jgi:hypothetical protein
MIDTNILLSAMLFPGERMDALIGHFLWIAEKAEDRKMDSSLRSE